jgi:hypothetical protein
MVTSSGDLFDSIDPPPGYSTWCGNAIKSLVGTTGCLLIRDTSSSDQSPPITSQSLLTTSQSLHTIYTQSQPISVLPQLMIQSALPASASQKKTLPTFNSQNVLNSLVINNSPTTGVSDGHYFFVSGAPNVLGQVVNVIPKSNNIGLLN